MADPVPILEISGLSRNFGGLKVIDGLALKVAKDEILGILGPNGAGKSTLFNLISGVLAPSGGSIRYQGREVTGLRAWDRCRLGIGRTYQIPKPFAHMSVFENVLVAAVHGAGISIGRARREAESVLERTGLLAQHARPAGALTLLDLKRLELARALAVQPKLLLLDEIAGGLTEGECGALIEIVLKVHAEGTGIVWIEHVIQALRRASTRLAVLHGGGIIADGLPDQVLANPQVKHVYLGTS